MTTINDQTGDGKPELVISGGQGVILILTLDSAVTSVDDGMLLSDTATATLRGHLLEVRLYEPCMISAELNRYDLSSVLSRQPRGAYLLRVRTGETFVTLSIVL